MSSAKKVLLFAVGFAVVFAIANSLYSYLKPAVAKSSRLACFKNVTTFERVYEREKLAKLQDLIRSGEFSLDFKIQKSEYAQSKLFDFVDIEDTKREFLTIFEHKLDAKNAKIKVLLYENDILDPRKKNADALIYAGYIRAGFLYENELIYQIQIDFMDKKGADIAQTIKCIKEAVSTI